VGVEVEKAWLQSNRAVVDVLLALATRGLETIRSVYDHDPEPGGGV
jgi:hypothetical protein